MIAHVEMSLSGPNFPTFIPIGASINYGMNMIPFATVDLDAQHLGLLCDFESFRRQPVTLIIRTIEGCLRFDGLVDGLSFYQQPGGISAQLVIKNEFQRLLELYPRMPGFHPGSENFFSNIETLDITTNPDPAKFLNRIDLDSDIQLDPNQNLIKFYVAATKAAVIAQQKLALVASRETDQDLSELIAISQKFADVSLPKALALIDKIDTTFTDGLTINASDSMVSEFAIRELESFSGTLLESLISALADFGCALVIANGKAFTVPESGFLKVPHASFVNRGERVFGSNIMYPAQYTSINFGDGGYKDIRAVYLVSDENVTMLNDGLKVELGQYIDPNATNGGILVMSLPKFVALGIDKLASQFTTEFRTNLSEGDTENVAASTIEDSFKLLVTNKQYKKDFKDRIFKLFTNNWAQMKYCQAKYTDRTGSITAFFNPNWAPGSVGTLFTRLPGTFIDFFVTAVTHRFSVSAPGTGEATTAISFNCGRMGKGLASGLDRIELFQYDFSTANKYAGAFIGNVKL